MRHKNILFRIGLFVSLWVFFSFPVTDADLGWHLRYGDELLATGQVSRLNTFSWLMPEYSWTNHSWGFDLILAALFGESAQRFWALSLGAGLLSAASVLLVLPPVLTTASLASVGVFVFFCSQLLNNGLRSQSFSLLFTALLWWILHRNRRYWLLIPLFFLWANIHGQFVYGLGILGLFVLMELRETKKISNHLPLIAASIASVGITLINPWGTSLWTTAASHLNNPALKYIYEWLPWDISSPRMILLLGLSAGLWWHVYTKRIGYPRSYLLPLISLTILALFSRRMIPYYLLLALQPMMDIFNLYIKKVKLPAPTPIMAVFGFLFVAVYSFTSRDVFNQDWNRYCNSHIYCSEKATEFIRTHNIQGKLFNAYRLGGYLIYRLPELKPMIDGRMTLWRNSDGYAPFSDYTKMVYVEPGSRDLFYRYNPDFVLIQKPYPLARALFNDEKWPVLYADEMVLLFVNPQLATSSAVKRQ